MYCMAVVLNPLDLALTCCCGRDWTFCYLQHVTEVVWWFYHEVRCWFSCKLIFPSCPNESFICFTPKGHYRFFFQIYVHQREVFCFFMVMFSCKPLGFWREIELCCKSTPKQSSFWDGFNWRSLEQGLRWDIFCRFDLTPRPILLPFLPPCWSDDLVRSATKMPKLFCFFPFGYEPLTVSVDSLSQTPWDGTYTKYMEWSSCMVSFSIKSLNSKTDFQVVIDVQGKKGPGIVKVAVCDIFSLYLNFLWD